MTPTLKAGIVKMVQNKGKNVVLAVGDGANDVAMIQVYSNIPPQTNSDVLESDIVQNMFTLASRCRGRNRR